MSRWRCDVCGQRGRRAFDHECDVAPSPDLSMDTTPASRDGAKLLELMRHAIAGSGSRYPYRNRYSTSEEDVHWERLCGLGLAVRGSFCGSARTYHVTRLGFALVFGMAREARKRPRKGVR